MSERLERLRASVRCLRDLPEEERLVLWSLTDGTGRGWGTCCGPGRRNVDGRHRGKTCCGAWLEYRRRGERHR
jgi:hypothetical protein